MLGLWICCGFSLQEPEAASARSTRPSVPPRWVGNFFQDEQYKIYAVKITAKLLPERIGEDVIVVLGITSDELVRLLGPPHQVLVEKPPRTGFNYAYFTTVDCYSFFFKSVSGNRYILYAIDANGGY
jgi:hypothetical protein